MDEITKLLMDQQDLKYRDFTIKLVPGPDADTIIGVRMPALRTIAKSIKDTPEAEAFMKETPHRYHEEVVLHGLLLNELKDYDEVVAELDRLLPEVNNWATCDLIRPKVFGKKKYQERLLNDIRRWMNDERPFVIRHGIGMLLNFFLDESFKPEYNDWVVAVRNDHYYVRMMVAWYFSTALVKQYEQTLPYLEQPMMEVWTHNKSIQKATESYRISDERKQYLRTLRR